jgi:tetratricopeptide (TPR) repeat protein
LAFVLGAPTVAGASWIHFRPNLIVSANKPPHTSSQLKQQTPELDSSFFNPKQQEALSSLQVGKTALRAGRARIALSHFKKALRLNPKFDLAHYYVGEAYRRLKDYPSCRISMLKALDLNPHLWEAHLALALTYEEDDQPALAIRHMQEAVHIFPDRAESHMFLGYLLDTNKRYKEAIEQYRDVVRLNPAAVNGWYNLGRIYREQEMFSEAIEAFRKALQLKPDNGDAHLGLGVTFLDTNDIVQSTRHLLKAREIFTARRQGVKAELARHQLSFLKESRANPALQKK